MKVLPKLLIIAAVFFAIAIAGGAWFFIQNRNPGADKVKSFKPGFTAYYPLDLPQGSAVPEDSITYNQGVLFYSITTDGGKLSVAQQTAPEGKLQTELPKTKELQVQAGKVIVTRFGHDRVIATITNEHSLLTLNGTLKITDEKLENILTSLAPVK